MFNRHSLACAIVAGSFALPSYSLAVDNKLDEMIVTANRMEKPIAQTLAPSSVYTRLDIDRLQVVDLPDLLGRLPGVSVNRSGGRGSLSSISIRGTNSSHALILLDGVRISSATVGQAQLEYIDPAVIERIELVRGPRASLYGSDAIGGVLQIFTRGGTENLQPSVRAAYGSHDSVAGSASISGSSNNTGYSLSAAHYDTDSIDSLVDDTGINADKDGFDNTSLTAKLSHLFDNGLDIALSHLYSDGANTIDDSYIDPEYDPIASDLRSEFELNSTALTLALPVGAKTVVHGVAGYTSNDTNNEDQLNLAYGYPNKFNSDRSSFGSQADFQLAAQQTLNLGADYYQDKIDSTENYQEQSRDNTGLYVQYEGQFGQHQLNASLRNDDNQQYGNEETGSIAWGWQFSSDLRLTSSYGTAFKAPTFNDLYWPFDGNPALQPETSDSAELELRGTVDDGYWAINAYKTNVDDLINWAPIDANDPYSPWQPSNVNSAEIEGVELSLLTHWDEIIISANASYLNTEDKDTGNELIGRPGEMLNIDLDRPFGKLELGASFRLRSHRYDDAYNSSKVSGFHTVDLRARYLLPHDFQIELALNNILDEETQTSNSYNGEGSNFMVTVHWLP